MSNAIAQSATQLSVTNGAEDWDEQLFIESAERATSRKAKGVTRERFMLKRPAIISAVAADYRNHFPSIYGRTERLPSSVMDKCEQATDKVLTKVMTAVNVTNIIGQRRAFHHASNDMMITERITNTGENTLTLQEQHCGIVIFLTQAEKRLSDFQKDGKPDREREQSMKAIVMKCQLTKQFIEAEMAHQKPTEA